MIRKDLELISEWIQPNTSVLDLGCGDGTLLRHLIDTKNIKGYGIEIAPENIAIAIAKGINVIQADLDKGLADFKHHAFDYVVMTQSLQAMYFPDQLLKEMLRVGKEAITSFPNMGHWRSRLQLTLFGHMPVTQALPHQWYNTPNIHLCTVQDFEKLCRTQNIKILQRAGVNNHYQATWGARLAPNLLGMIAIYRFQQQKLQ